MRRLVLLHLTVVGVVLASLLVPADVRAGSRDYFVGAGVTLHPVSPGTWSPSVGTTPWILAIQKVDGVPVAGMQFCEFETGCLLGIYFPIKQFACWKMISGAGLADTLPGSTVFYGGARLTEQDSSTSWYAVKVIDAGPCGIDRIGFRHVTRRAYDGRCGAADIPTYKLIAGDFQRVDSSP